MRLLRLIALVAVIILPARADEVPCTLVRLASLQLSPLNGLNTVEAQMNGHKTNLVVDTGAAISMLKASAAARLGLPLHTSTTVKLLDVFGHPVNKYVIVDEVMLDRLRGTKMVFMIMPDEMASLFMDGLLGPDIMSAFDIEFDFAKSQLNLYSPKHCEGQVVYWTSDPYAKVPIRLDDIHHIFINLELDGQKVESYIDTGAGSSFMSLKLARRLFKWRADPPELISRTDRINNTATTTYTYPFKSLSFEGVSVTNPEITIGDKILKGDEGRLLIGMNILSKLHLYIDYKEKKLYATARDAKAPPGVSFAPPMGFTTPETPQWPEPLKP